MAITVDSSQWTGKPDDAAQAVSVVWGEFASEAAREEAASRLRAAGARDAASDTDVGDGAVQPPDDNPAEADRRNQRQLQVGTTMAATSMAAAGLVIATGGAAALAMAAAAAAGAATAVVGEPVADALISREGQTPDRAERMPPPPLEGPTLGVRAPNAATRSRAEHLLRELGARRIVVQEARAG